MENRKLSTVLFADIAGYTSLMQTDEKRAMLFLHQFKESLQEIVPLNRGEIIQYYGDAVLLTFDSAKEGVECAIALQKSFKAREIPIRIGMHLGDVIFKEDNVFGDGVNIASRIESMGVPGAILVSKAIRDQIRNKSEFTLASLGFFDLKNVAEPVKVFALANEGLVVPDLQDMKGKGNPSRPGKPKWHFIVLPILAIAGLILASSYFFSKADSDMTSDEFGIESTIAVFPFDVKGSPDIEYLGDGIVDLICTQLDEIPKLNSVDPNRVFSKLANETTISRKPEKAAELSNSMGASKFILGSIVQIDDDLQISATKYDELGKEINRQSVQANKTEGIAKTINDLIKELVADELQAVGYELGSLGALTSNNLESLKYYLQGEQAYRELDYRKAHELFTKATELDSTFALAWMRMFEADSWIGWDSDELPRQKWTQYKHTMPLKWQLYHDAKTLQGNVDRRAIPAYKKLIQRYGDTPAFHYGLAEFYFHLNEIFGRSPAEAKPYLLKTIELDPGNQEALWHLGNIAVMENNMEDMQKVLSMKEGKESASLKMLELIIKDTVTDAEIEQVLSLTSRSTFFPVLYFAGEEKPFHNDLISRIFQLRPDVNGERLANVARFYTTGREKEGFSAWKEAGKIGFTFGVFNMEQIYRCIPATLMAAEDFLPFNDNYESLYLETKDRDTPWETFAAIKYAMALKKNREATALKQKLQTLDSTPQTRKMVKYFNFSLQAFEARMAGENDKALAYIDSAYLSPIGYWETQVAAGDKNIMAANIYADRSEFEKAISYFDHSYVITMGGAVLMGYRNYKLSQWYEAVGDYKNALTKCNILLESYKNCDEKYRPWVEEAKARQERLIAKMN